MRRAYCHHHCGTVASYEPGPLCLYRCAQFTVRKIDIGTVKDGKADLVIVLSNGSRRITRYEHLTYKPHNGTLKITDVDNY